MAVLLEVKTAAFWRDVAAEFVGTFILVAVMAALHLRWGSDKDLTMPVSVGMGFIVASLVWTFKDFGGAHFNPALTLSLAILRRTSIIRAIVYMITQVVAGMAGAGFIYGITPPQHRLTLGAFMLHPELAHWQGFLTEVYVTFNLIITILGATNSRRKGNQLYMPIIPIGFAIAVGIMAAFESTMGCMNPACYFGPALVMGIWEHHWVYWLGPMVGAVLGTLFYTYILDRIQPPPVLSDHSSEDSCHKESKI